MQFVLAVEHLAVEGCNPGLVHCLARQADGLDAGCNLLLQDDGAVEIDELEEAALLATNRHCVAINREEVESSEVNIVFEGALPRVLPWILPLALVAA